MRSKYRQKCGIVNVVQTVDGSDTELFLNQFSNISHCQFCAWRVSICAALISEGATDCISVMAVCNKNRILRDET